MRPIEGTVNWGIIGCGDVCEVKSGPAFNKVPHSRLVAVMRRDEAKAKDFAKRHQVPFYHSDAQELVNNEQVNAVYIATPPAYHEQYTQMALSAGKPVYVEKPVSLNSLSTERMIALEKKYNGKVSVAHYRRNLPLFKKIKQVLEQERIGTVKLVLLSTLQPLKSKIIHQTSDNWRINPALSGGGLFHDLSPHQLDILYWLFGRPLDFSVTALNQGKHYNAPDLTTVQIQFDKGIYCNGTWNFNVAEVAAEDCCEIIGDKGSIRFSFFRVSTLELKTENGQEIFTEPYPVNIQEPHIHAVVDFFRGQAENPCSLEDALVTMQVMDKAVLHGS